MNVHDLTKWTLVGLGLCAAMTAAVASGCLPVIRTDAYARLVAEFKDAAPLEKGEKGGVAWNSEVAIAGRAAATVSARDHMDVVTVKYADEARSRPLYEYVDYSSPVSLRRSGATLYVHWAETLFRTEHWLLAYDLAGRREIARRRVRAEDLPTAQLSTRRSRAIVAAADPPPGVAVPGVQWLKVAAPEGGVMLSAVVRPAQRELAAAIILLHGTHGFAREYIDLARALARHGLVAVAACWFRGGDGPGTRFITPIACPEGPPLTAAADAAARQRVEVLVEAVRTLPGVREDAIALFGHSRGGGAALHYALGGASVQAVILNSAGYPDTVPARASELKVPLLILHGSADRPADGGSPMTDVVRARAFEAAARKAGAVVEASYFEGAGHNGIFTDAAQHAAAVRRILAFARRHLGEQ